MRKYTSANMRSWMKVILLFAMFWMAVSSIPAPIDYARVVNESAKSGKNGSLNFAQNGDISEQMNAELLGAVKERHKRLSDQRRAELETLMALSKMTGKFVNVTRGGRQFEAIKVGKKKRSVFEMNMKNLRKLFKLSGKLGYKGNPAFPVVR